MSKQQQDRRENGSAAGETTTGSDPRTYYYDRIRDEFTENPDDELRSICKVFYVRQLDGCTATTPDAVIDHLSEAMAQTICRDYNRGAAACYAQLDTPTRPEIGAVVQFRYGTDWNYTGLVTEHHPDLPDAYFVQWHKWGNADDRSLWGWEYNMSNCRVITRPVPGQWWPATLRSSGR